jgi:hypothetical protein
MNAAEIEVFRQTRIQMSLEIIACADLFKICLVCGSLHRKTAGRCEICGAYQWDEDPEAVKDNAALAASGVFPLTLGYAPSIPRAAQPFSAS